MEDEFDKWIAGLKAEEARFWEETYPKLSGAAKLQHWVASIHRTMRTQGEATGDEYSAMDADWYAECCKVEPRFESMLVTIIQQLPIRDPQDFYSAIGQPLPESLRK